jgi:glycosyltransferase involved in cell wall biosynthesis
MRIAYITPYQGPELIRRRPSTRNRSLAGNQKIEVIAKLLMQNGHDVEIISQGEVDHFQCRYYPRFSEQKPLHGEIPVLYSSSLPLRFLNGFWSNFAVRRDFLKRHKASPFDLVLLYNLKRPVVFCGIHASRRLGLPVVLEYEDDGFVSVLGEKATGLRSRIHGSGCAQLMRTVAGCIAVSPYLESQVSQSIPRLLLRGVVDDDLCGAENLEPTDRKNWVVFSGTHVASKGIIQLIEAWQALQLPDWELHITGYGKLTEELRSRAEGVNNIVFHGLVDRATLTNILRSAKICINPHELSRTPGNVFAFKIIEYLAAGAHVVTTSMGVLEKELEAGITYLPDNKPSTIAATLTEVIHNQRWKQNVASFVWRTYGSAAVARALDELLCRVSKSHGHRAEGVVPSLEPSAAYPPGTPGSANAN